MLLAIAAAYLIPKFTGTKIPLGVTIATLTVVATILNGTITSVLQTKLKMHIASMLTVFGKVISVGLMAYIVYYGLPQDSDQGFYWLIAAGVVGNTAMLLGTIYFTKKITPLKFQLDTKLWKSLLKKSVPYGLALILNAIYFRIDSMLLLFMKGPEEVGVYGVAMKILEHFAIIPLYFMNSVLPVLTKSIKEKSQKYKDVIRYSFDFLASMSAPLVVGGFILAFPIIFIISTPEFLSDIPNDFYGSDIALKILIFALAFQFLNILFAFILIALDKQTKLLYINAVGVMINISLNFIVIPAYGFRGAALTSVLSELYILIATFLVARHLISFQINLKNLFKISLSAIVMGFAVYYLQPVTYTFLENWNVLLLIPLGATIYLAMLFITGTVDKNTIKLLKR